MTTKPPCVHTKSNECKRCTLKLHLRLDRSENNKPINDSVLESNNWATTFLQTSARFSEKFLPLLLFKMCLFVNNTHHIVFTHFALSNDKNDSHNWNMFWMRSQRWLNFPYYSLFAIAYLKTAPHFFSSLLIKLLFQFSNYFKTVCFDVVFNSLWHGNAEHFFVLFFNFPIFRAHWLRSISFERKLTILDCCIAIFALLHFHFNAFCSI